jgi:hypothetical protein
VVGIAPMVRYLEIAALGVALAGVLMALTPKEEAGDYALMREGVVQSAGISKQACDDLINMHMGMDPGIAANLKCINTAPR